MRNDDERFLFAAVTRREALAALAAGPLTRDELREELGVSRTTVHRTVRALESESLLRREGDGNALTALGEVVADATVEFEETLRAARHLRPFLAVADVDVDVRPFADATVTVQGPAAPYRPVSRFVSLLEETTALRGFDTAALAPLYVETIRERILGGMEAEIVYPEGVVDGLAEAYPEALSAALDGGTLRLFAHDDLPYGLALFDDRVGLGGYDAETGMLRAFVDTDDAAAIEWGERQFRRYRSEATPIARADG